MNKTTKFTMTRKKETKGTVVFENSDAPVPSMYVRKGNDISAAQVIEVSITTITDGGEK